MAQTDRSTAIGKSIDAYLKGEIVQEDHVVHLLFSANRWEAAESMRARIAAGVTIVVDRYYYSGIVYSAAKDNAELTLQWAREPEVGLPRPDLCIFLDIAPSIAMQRGGFGSEIYETSKMQQKVRELFHELLKGPDGQDITFVDAGRSIEDVQQDLRSLVENTLNSENLQQPLRKITRWS